MDFKKTTFRAQKEESDNRPACFSANAHFPACAGWTDSPERFCFTKPLLVSAHFCKSDDFNFVVFFLHLQDF